MKSTELNLRDFAECKDQRVIARLEGEIDDDTARLWGEEFSASGGKMPPTPTPGPAPHK